MKEATGELSSGVIVIMSVAILIAFFSFTIWPMIKDSFEKDTACKKAVCSTSPDAEGYVNCRYKDTTIKCAYKG